MCTHDRKIELEIGATHTSPFSSTGQLPLLENTSSFSSGRNNSFNNTRDDDFQRVAVMKKFDIPNNGLCSDGWIIAEVIRKGTGVRGVKETSESLLCWYFWVKRLPRPFHGRLDSWNFSNLGLYQERERERRFHLFLFFSDFLISIFLEAAKNSPYFPAKLFRFPRLCINLGKVGKSESIHHFDTSLKDDLLIMHAFRNVTVLPQTPTRPTLAAPTNRRRGREKFQERKSFIATRPAERGLKYNNQIASISKDVSVSTYRVSCKKARAAPPNNGTIWHPQ